MKVISSPGARDELIHRLLTVQPGDVARWGTMCAAEMLCHVRGAFQVASGAMSAGEAPPPPMPGQLLKFFALRVPLRWPPNVPTVSELKAGAAAMQPGDFEQDREGAVQRLREFAGLGAVPHRHPIFGRMSRWDWMRWAYLHTDHHLRQFGR